MVINIPTTDKKYFRQCLEILKVFPPLDKASNRELDVLGGLLYYNYKFRDIKDIKLRNKLIFDYDTLIAISDDLEIPKYSVDNLISKLRKNKIIRGRELLSNYGISLDTTTITFNFNIEKND